MHYNNYVTKNAINKTCGGKVCAISAIRKVVIFTQLISFWQNTNPHPGFTSVSI